MSRSECEFAKDLNIYSREFSQNPHETFDELRARCPVAKSDELEGYWLLTRYQDVVAAAQDPSTFSSRFITIPRNVGGEGLEERPPITLDPPRHLSFRRLLLAGFSAKQALVLEPAMRNLARSAIGTFVEKGRCDAAVDFAKKIPVGVMCLLMGVPLEMEPTFFRWANDIFESGDIELSTKAAGEISSFFDDAIAARTQLPTDDLISVLMATEMDGQRLTSKELVGALALILIAGLDTVWSVLSNTLRYLAENPDVRRQLIEEPSLMATAVEEFLRYFAPASLARVTTKATKVDGIDIGEDETVLLAFPSANRDPGQFPNADQLILDRDHNTHLAFGIGSHRCLGIHIARLELRVGIEEWLQAIPDYELEDADAVEYSIGQVWGPRSVPVRFPTK